MKETVISLDLFSGAGGLTEGFLNDNYKIIAHIEKDSDACLTLKTRLSYHYLLSQNKLDIYYDYLNTKISREELYSKIPLNLLNSVINDEISPENFENICKKIDKKLKGRKVDFMFGGPPCQAYSLVGRARDKNSMQFDSRKYLYKEYIRYLERYKPKLFLFENVKGLLSSRDENNNFIIDTIRQDFENAGYLLEYKILNAKDFGVSQNRERVIIIGYRNTILFSYPEFEISKPFSIRTLFQDLPEINSAQTSSCYKFYTEELVKYRTPSDFLTQHESRKNNQNDLEIYRIAALKYKHDNSQLKYNDLPVKLIKHNNKKSFLDRFKVVAMDGISHTIVAHIAKDGHYYIHPDISQNRSLTVREAARIQSFPDSYFFEKNRTSAFRQIGNAVPPLMSKQIAKKILEYF